MMSRLRALAIPIGLGLLAVLGVLGVSAGLVYVLTSVRSGPASTSDSTATTVEPIPQPSRTSKPWTRTTPPTSTAAPPAPVDDGASGQQDDDSDSDDDPVIVPPPPPPPPQDNPPSITSVAVDPGTATCGGSFTVTAFAQDDHGVVGGTVVAADTTYSLTGGGTSWSASIPVPAGAETLGSLQLFVNVSDGAGHTASATTQVNVTC